MSGNYFDLKTPAPNGLKRGYATGSCATAAAKAALRFLLSNDQDLGVEIDLPSGQRLSLTTNFIRRTENGAMAQITKDSGDDPDVTDKCLVEVEVRKNATGDIRFIAGSGVGTVTENGLQIPKGQAAINPVPRKMIEHNLRALLQKPDCPSSWKNAGVDVIVSIPGGDKLALKTFNPRVGVQGGLSILGTTGIVEPMSLSAWKASIEIYIDVAIATQSDFIVFSPGRWGQNFFHKQKGVPLNRICMISNFVGFALDYLKQQLQDKPHTLKNLVLAGHPGKLAKVIDGHWDTHSKESPIATSTILGIASLPEKLTDELRHAKTVEELIQISKAEKTSDLLFNQVANAIAQTVHSYINGILDVNVYLGDFKGDLIGTCESESFKNAIGNAEGTIDDK